MKRSSRPGPATPGASAAAARPAPNAARPRWRIEPLLALVAAACCLAALLGFGAALDGYSHWRHPPGLLGAQGLARAAAFNLFGFIVPGLLLAALAWRLRERYRALGAAARIGAWLCALSALAWAGQGLLRLDPSDLDAHASRLHATSWMLWWLAFVPGAALLALGARKARPALAAVAATGAAAVLAIVIGSELRLLAAPPAQRLALLLWLGTYAGAAWLAVSGERR